MKMAMAGTSAIEMSSVVKLAKRLRDATAVQSSQQEESITKILEKLSTLPMTIEILKVTEVGRQVNALRKWGGMVSKRAKSLVKKWKQLLPEGEEGQDHHQTSEGAGQGVEPRLEGVSLAMRGLREEEWPAEQVRVPVSVFETESRAGGSCVEDAAAHSHKRHHRDKEKKKKKKKKRNESIPSHSFEGSFSQALDVPVHATLPNSRHAHVSERHLVAEKPVGRSSVARSELEDVVLVGASPGPTPAGPGRTLARERSPAVAGKAVPRVPAQREATAGVKRKEPPPQESTIGLSKRSRTQVYSGKKAATGPQVVTSLFDMCMKILIDNIDFIEDVGPGVPYHVLEPLLQRCSASQLLKLEDFNPHLVEDTDELWRKHVAKDFKITKLPPGELWRDLYKVKLAEREEKLRQLTARIKANNDAREEPKRKVILSDATRKPGRRSGMRRGGGFPGTTMERPHQGSELRKRTLKMAKERNHMVGFGRGRGRK